MFPLLALTLAAPPAGPTVASPDFAAEAQWAAVAASPKFVSLTGEFVRATGVTIGVKDGVAYVLTAAHAVPGDEKRVVRYYAAKSYPKIEKEFPVGDVVVHLPAADVALVKVAVDKWPVPVLKLAGPGQRPKTFPSAALSVGCTDGDAPTCELVSVRAKRLVRRGAAGDAFFWEAATPPRAGRSGGPLLSSAGQVIGLASAAQDGNGYYSHLDEILAGLKKHECGWLWE